MRITLLVVLLLSIAGSTLAQDLWIRRSPAVNSYLFEAVIAIGDTNGDGCSELLQPVLYQPGKPTPPSPFDVFHIISGRDHSVLHAIQSNAEDATLGYAVGDLDRDGAADFCVARIPNNSFFIEFYSGRTMQVIFRFLQPTPPIAGNVSLNNIGDVNADQFEDIAIGATRMTGYGGCLVISGKDGSLIHNVPVPSPPGSYSPHSFGSAVCAAGDVNQDGHADFYVADNYSGYNSDPYGASGSVFLFSGKDASLLGHWNGSWRSWFGTSLLLGSDLDHDGIRELLVGAPGYLSSPSGVIYRINPRNPQQTNTFSAPSPAHERYGGYLAPSLDFDLDGVNDFHTTAVLRSKSAGLIASSQLAISGADGKVLWEYQDTRPVKDHYVGFFSSGDINGDGRTDLILGYSLNWLPSPSALPYYEILCDSLALRSNERQLSLSGNDTQYFELDAGPAHANAPYLLLGSLSGISPGLPLGRCTLPLNPDPYLLFSITAPNTTLLPGGLGILDAQGKASARFVAIPGLPPSFAGTRIDHAFVTFDSQGPGFCSNWIPLLLAK
jgi:hypothetical protein